MQDISTLSFIFEPLTGCSSALAAVPVVSGVSLIELVGQFERERNYHLPGDYTGLGHHDLTHDNPTIHYCLSDCVELPASDQRTLLGCTCGFADCWPLMAVIVRDEEHVIWQSIEQPHRPEQDYSEFGPFVFDVDQYNSAISELVLREVKFGA